MAFDNLKIAFIGSGVMGEAMIKGLLHQQLVTPQQVIAADPSTERGAELAQRYGLHFTSSNSEAAEAGDIIVLSVKPQVVDRVLPELRRGAHSATLILSIAAGVTIHTIVNGVANPSVVRSMPNTPAQIGQGITVWTATAEVRERERELTRIMLGALGEELYVDDEKFLDMATALNGTGPAYVFMMMEAMIDAGVHMGLSRREAERLVLQTMRGSIEYAAASGLHPAQLRNQVTSPGGTSAAAIYEMEKGRLRTVLADAIWAAYRRSVELGGGKGKPAATSEVPAVGEGD